jgi:hypothetical protein
MDEDSYAIIFNDVTLNMRWNLLTSEKNDLGLYYFRQVNIVASCGVYAPSNCHSEGKLFYKGNYNVSRYCNKLEIPV